MPLKQNVDKVTVWQNKWSVVRKIPMLCRRMESNMKFNTYMQDRWKTIILLLFAVITVEIFLLIYDVDVWLRIYTGLVISIAYVIGNALEYHSKKRFYDDMHMKLDGLEKKYLVMEMIENEKCVEELELSDIVHEMGTSMTEHVNTYRRAQEEYKDYIEMWIHEVKLPIATAKMIIENNKDDVTKRIEDELNEIENYTEQALYYARSNHTQKDYFVAKVNLREMITETIKKKKRVLIAQKMKVEVNISDAIYVYTDAKWCQFVLNQIIQNSIQYKAAENACITFTAQEKKEQIVLSIADNGIGVKSAEVDRVFEKGFCGTNGRGGKKATGIGLYLCKKLCDKLGHRIELESEAMEGVIQGSKVETLRVQTGTTVKIIFPCNSFMQF